MAIALCVCTVGLLRRYDRCCVLYALERLCMWLVGCVNVRCAWAVLYLLVCAQVSYCKCSDYSLFACVCVRVVLAHCVCLVILTRLCGYSCSVIVCCACAFCVYTRVCALVVCDRICVCVCMRLFHVIGCMCCCVCVSGNVCVYVCVSGCGSIGVCLFAFVCLY